MASDAARLVELRREQLARACRADLTVCAEVLVAKPMLAHHRLLLGSMQKVVDGEIPRLIVLSPPASGKSTLLSHVAVAWALGHRAGLQVIGCTHSQNLAERGSELLQDTIREHQALLGYRLTSDNAARGRWGASNGGSYFAASAGMRIRGLRSNLTLIDDPFGSRADAESEAIRLDRYNWFQSDVLSRPSEPSDAIVLTSTAYHQDDLMSKLIREQSDRWTIVRIPAVSEGEGDLLNRPFGEPLANGLPYGAWLLQRRAELEQAGLSREWEATFQGAPQPPSGALFHPDKLRVAAGPDGTLLSSCRGWDFAASAGRGDWTVGARMEAWRDHAGQVVYVIADIRRVRADPSEVRRLVLSTAAMDGYATSIALPQDPGSAGVDQASSFVSMLAGYRVETERMSGSKEIRAEPLASQVNAGHVTMLQAGWNLPLIDEFGSFPYGSHDDIVDAAALAFSRVAQRPPMKINPAVFAELGIHPRPRVFFR